MEGLRDRQGDKLMVILFWAAWYPECEDLRLTLEKIAENLQHIIICWVSAQTTLQRKQYRQASLTEKFYFSAMY